MSSDFDLEVIDSFGNVHKIKYIIPEDAYYYLPGKTLTMFIEDENMIAYSQDKHALLQITYKNTDKVFNSKDLELVDNSRAYGYLTTQDVNWLYPFSTWWTFFFGRYFNIVAFLIFALVLMTTLLTTTTTIVPMWLVLHYCQEVYFTQCAGIRYN